MEQFAGLTASTQDAVLCSPSAHCSLNRALVVLSSRQGVSPGRRRGEEGCSPGPCRPCLLTGIAVIGCECLCSLGTLSLAKGDQQFESMQHAQHSHWLNAPLTAALSFPCPLCIYHCRASWWPQYCYLLGNQRFSRELPWLHACSSVLAEHLPARFAYSGCLLHLYSFLILQTSKSAFTNGLAHSPGIWNGTLILNSPKPSQPSIKLPAPSVSRPATVCKLGS